MAQLESPGNGELRIRAQIGSAQDRARRAILNLHEEPAFGHAKNEMAAALQKRRRGIPQPHHVVLIEVQAFFEHHDQSANLRAHFFRKAAQVGRLASSSAAGLDAEDPHGGGQKSRVDAESVKLLIIAGMIDLVHVGDRVQHVQPDNKHEQHDRPDQAVQAEAVQRPDSKSRAQCE